MPLLPLMLACEAPTPEAPGPASSAGEPAPEAPRTHGGVIRVVDGAHVEVVAVPTGVKVYLYDEELRPRDIPTGVRPRASIEGVGFGFALQLDGYRGFVPATLAPGTEVEVSLGMQFHGSLKPGGLDVRVPVGVPVEDTPVRHGGTLFPVGDLTVEYLAKDGAHTLWFTDVHGHLEEEYFQVELSDGTQRWGRTGISDTVSVADPAAGTRPIELTVRAGNHVLDEATGIYLQPAGTLRLPAARAPAPP